MRVELKLYKNYDADLISLNANGISVTMLMKKALEYYVRGQQITFVVPNAIPFTLKEKKRTYHLLFEIKDKTSVDFLRREIKEGWRKRRNQLRLKNYQIIALKIKLKSSH